VWCGLRQPCFLRVFRVSPRNDHAAFERPLGWESGGRTHRRGSALKQSSISNGDACHEVLTFEPSKERQDIAVRWPDKLLGEIGTCILRDVL
jgi:hypothetical protein